MRAVLRDRRYHPDRPHEASSTNIGPDLAAGGYAFPTSLIGRIEAWRASGMSPQALPLMSKVGDGSWIFCRLLPDSAPVCIPKGDREFGASDREWNELAADFSTFIDRLAFDVSPLLPGFRAAGTSRVTEPMRQLLLTALGEDWESQIADLCTRQRR